MRAKKRANQKRRRIEITTRELLRSVGLSPEAIALYDYLKAAGGWHDSHSIAEHFGVQARAVHRWAAPLCEAGYLDRDEAPGSSEGGRLPASYRVRVLGKPKIPLQRHLKSVEKVARALARGGR